jgi:hypothetical protein
VEVWVRGALVRFAVIWWPPQGGSGPQAEIVHKELVGTTHFWSYRHLVCHGWPPEVLKLAIQSFWEEEDYASTCEAWAESDQQEDSSTTGKEEAA